MRGLCHSETSPLKTYQSTLFRQNLSSLLVVAVVCKCCFRVVTWLRLDVAFPASQDEFFCCTREVVVCEGHLQNDLSCVEQVVEPCCQSRRRPPLTGWRALTEIKGPHHGVKELHW